MTITALPTPPSTSAPSTFGADADAFIAALPTLVTQINALTVSLGINLSTYLGPLAANPTLDNQGNALVEGAFYYNTVDKQVRMYDGANWAVAYSGAYLPLAGGTTTGPVIVGGNAAIGSSAIAAWGANYRAIQVGLSGAMWAGATGELLGVRSNAYFTGAVDKRISAGSASDLFQSGGVHTFACGSNGAADSIISWSYPLSVSAANAAVSTAFSVAGATTLAALTATGATTLAALGATSGVFSSTVSAANATASGHCPTYAQIGLGKAVAKAWVNFDGTLSGTITPRANFNVASVTKNGTGDYTLNFSSALTDANYSHSFGVTRNGALNANLNMSGYSDATRLESSFRVVSTITSSTTQEDPKVACVNIFGN